ncbi:MAG: glutathione ABC transporter permease GsiC [Candidatus Rokubacteria bacterium RBG_16_73_20]|nr:MAG: glutathione ABC transporter permease GsiC [Candidatus Rokubacteria bacterium RBG_16_73_20]
MHRYVALRLASLAPILFGVSLLVFSMQHLVPGDIVDIVIGGDQAFGDKNAADRLRGQLNLDRPIVEQYVLWLGNALRGDLGTSFVSGRPVLDEILRRLPVNLQLAALAIGFALLLGIPVGTFSAVRSDTWADAAVRFASVLGYSIPNFWVATLTVLLGSLYFPRMPILQYVPFGADPVRNLTLLAIPAFVLSLTVLPLIVRMTRASVLENLRLDYVRTARAKGLAERRVVFRHVLANSLIAVLNVTGVQVGILIGGLVLTEEIFILPGVGRFLLDSIQKRDFPVITGTTLFLAAAFVCVNLLVDLLHGVLDPRIRR